MGRVVLKIRLLVTLYLSSYALLMAVRDGDQKAYIVTLSGPVTSIDNTRLHVA